MWVFGYTAVARIGEYMPKQHWREFSLAIADQFLIVEDSEVWIKQPQVRRAWHLSLTSTILLAVYLFISKTIFGFALERSITWTFLWRLSLLFIVGWLVLLEGILASVYYRYLLSTSRDLRFRNIALFWISWVLHFALLYIVVYSLDPTLFSYPISVSMPGKTVHSIGFLPLIKSISHFLLYSACTTVSLTLPGLTSASLVVSALNLVEILGSLLLLALLVATFVNKSDLKKRKS
jgi:hypothetical protein